MKTQYTLGDGQILEFYKIEESQSEFNFRIVGDSELTDKLLSVCVRKTVLKKDFFYAVSGIEHKLSIGLDHSLNHMTADASDDPVVKLGLLCQEKWNMPISFTVVNKQGPRYATIIDVELKLPNEKVFSGSGSNTKIAEQNAARAAIKSFSP